MAPFPEIKSTHSLVAKHVTEELWNKLGDHKTETSGFTLGQVVKIGACGDSPLLCQFDNVP